MVAGESGSNQEGAPLLNRESGSSLPRPIRAIHAGLLFAYICIGRIYGLFGLGALLGGSIITIFVTLFLGWFAGCATMVLCFASCFCFGAGNAARGKYELASPVLLAALLLVGSGILGSHFFATYQHNTSGISIGSEQHPIDVEELLNNTHHFNLAHVYLANGEVVTKFVGESKWCKDKLPVVGTCINRFFCVAPILPHNYSEGTLVTAWAGIEWTTSCTGVHFQHAPLRKNWNHDYKRGIGFLRNRHWDDAIHSTVKKFKLKTSDDAPLMHWVKDPTANATWAWGMGWFVELTSLTLFLVCISTYNYCSGNTKSAVPEAMKILNGPEDPTWQRYRQRQRASRANPTPV